jgi:superfamily II DNA/RNA helicase
MPPELRLSRLLDEYRGLRDERLSGESKRVQSASGLLISHLQQRLLSSIEAFARTLRVHRRTVQRQWEASRAPQPTSNGSGALRLDLLGAGISSDDDRTTQSDQVLAEEEDDQIEAATIASRRIERSMLEGDRWNDLRVLIFTEYDDTKRYLKDQLAAALAHTSRADDRIRVFHGPTPADEREEIKRAFNAPPKHNPLRILIATDAAREGLNLQAHCWNLFHFDLPWNPSRLEQRNGRIDRKLQPSETVYCHYFVYLQRPEDRVLRVLVRKTETIRKDLGSLAQVVEAKLEDWLKLGIRHSNVESLSHELETADLEAGAKATVRDELEEARERQDALRHQIDLLRNRLEDSREWIGLDDAHLRQALDSALDLVHAAPLHRVDPDTEGPLRYTYRSLREVSQVHAPR